jgi:hypothetical protein
VSERERVGSRRERGSERGSGVAAEMSDRSAFGHCDAGVLSDHPPKAYVMRSSGSEKKKESMKHAKRSVIANDEVLIWLIQHILMGGNTC